MTEVVTVGSAIAGGPSLVRNSAWNLAGHLLPLLAAVVAIPILIEAMGVERFGVLMLAWVVIGYFSLFDLGLGRAMTQLLAEKLGQGRSGDIAPLVWTGLSLMAGLGIVGALLLLALSGWLLFVLVAGVLAVGAATGVVGKWGYGLALLFGLLAVPVLMAKTVFFGLAMLVKLLPFLLVAYGIYVLLRAFGR